MRWILVSISGSTTNATPGRIQITLLLSVCVALGCRGPQADDLSENLIAFVGGKLSVRELPVAEGSFNSKWEATYSVIEVVYGEFGGSLMTFHAYDHYGRPRFANYDQVLLYVSWDGDDLVHQKYLFQPVYMTDGGDWFGCGDPYKGV